MSHRIRLLCIAHDLQGGGAEIGALMLLDALGRTDFDISLYLLSDQGSLHKDIPSHVRVFFGSRGRLSPKWYALPILARLILLARDSDVVFAALEGSPFYAAVLAGRIARRPVVGSLRAPWTDILQDLAGWHRPISRILYPAADVVVTASQSVRQDLTSFLGAPRPLIEVIPSFRRISDVRRRSGDVLPDWALEVFSRPALVSVGRLERVKGHDRLIRAFSKAVTDGLDANLLIVGEGSLRPELEALVLQCELQDRIYLPGSTENPYPLISRGRALVVTSHFEGSPGVMIEAMALGVPIVAFDCPQGPREMLGDEAAGLLVVDGDESALAKAMSQIVEDEGQRKMLSRRGLERSKAFDAPAAIERYRSLFQSLVRGSSGR